MRPHCSTTQRWRTSAISAFFATALFLKFTAGSQTQPDNKDNTPEVICDGPTDGRSADVEAACELKESLSGLPASDLENLVAYYRGDKVEISKAVPQGSGEALVWKLFFYGVSKVALASLISQVLKFVLTKQGEHTCYDTIGCFTPQNRTALEIGGPTNPEKSEVKFYFYTNSSPAEAEVDYTNWQTVTNRTSGTRRKLTAIIHGFKENRHTTQVVNLRDALLVTNETDIIVADWKKEAAFPYYGAAAANTPLVGAKLSLLLISMFNQLAVHPDDVHLIGFSLGAHAAGVCGRHFYDRMRQLLGRISGLDPAGLLFENRNVSLSTADAKYVDVIHTNGGNITELRFGTKSPLGHADFYPNGGSYQERCKGDSYTITCDHNKAWWLYIESVQNETCKFEAIHCIDWLHYEECKKSGTGERAVMGYYSDTSKANGTYYLAINPHSPYCIPQEESRQGAETKNETPTETNENNKSPR